MPLALALVLLAGTAAAAVVPAPGYLARTLATPDVVQGGVVRHAGAVLVGQGSFGPASEYVVRLDSAGSTVVATGFNSLGGIDVAPNGELFVVDNGGELPGAVTGDTLFEFPDALTRQTSLAAAGHEVLPPGTLPAAQDVLLVPETLLVTEATGPGAGRVLRVSEQGLPSPFVGGLDYASGLAFGSTGAVYVAELDASFVGRVRVFDYVTGELRREVASGLSGAFAVALDADGETVLVSGGVADDGSGTIVAVAPDGTMTERARGFAFATEMFFDPTREELLVLDVGARAITILCADADGDGTCDADDPCTTERAADAVRLRLGTRLAVRGRTVVPAPIDPAAAGLRLVVEGTDGTRVDLAVPGGARWKQRGHRWTWRAPRKATTGISRIVLRARGGKLDFALHGRRLAAGGAAGDVTVALVLDPPAIRRSCAVAAVRCIARRGDTLHCR